MPSLPKLPCPRCGSYYSRVANPRPDLRGLWITRTRICQGCGHHYQTRERVLPPDPPENSTKHNMW